MWTQPIDVYYLMIIRIYFMKGMKQNTKQMQYG